MLYIRRIFHQDITHQMTANRDGSLYFFEYDYRKQGIEDRKIEFQYYDLGLFPNLNKNNIIGILHPDNSESRINGQFKQFIMSELNAQENDILLIKNTNRDKTKFELSIIKPKNTIFYNYLAYLLGAKNNHLVLTKAPFEDLSVNQLNNIDSNLNNIHQNIKKIFNPTLLSALRTKPFVLLAGISGTGKSRIVRELAYASCPKELQDEKETTPGNYCMVEVKPNWHDSSELLGYYSSISKQYFLTKFVHFIYKAIQYPNVPFFVCLDEMNLAPVEQYFAEFLSVLETRKMVDGKCVSEQLIKKKEFEKCQIPEELDDSDTNTHIKIVTETYYSNEELEIISYLKDNGLILPENVFVIGTVNMDDTTHQFSRKVIDRAMTIEMNGGNLENMFGGSKKLNYVSNPLPLDAFKSKYINADEVLEVHQDCAEQIKKQTVEKLNSINNILKDTPFIVSYRVLNELVIYLGNLLDDNKYQGDGNDEEFSKMIDNAITDIVMMKILPRIEGDSELLDDKLEQLIKMFNNSDSEIYKKLTEMNNRLKNLSYTRFWA